MEEKKREKRRKPFGYKKDLSFLLKCNGKECQNGLRAGRSNMFWDVKKNLLSFVKKSGKNLKVGSLFFHSKYFAIITAASNSDFALHIHFYKLARTIQLIFYSNESTTTKNLWKFLFSTNSQMHHICQSFLLPGSLHLKKKINHYCL